MKIMFSDYIDLLIRYDTVVIKMNEQFKTTQLLFNNAQNTCAGLLEFYNNHSDCEISSILLNPWDNTAELTLQEKTFEVDE